MQKEKTIQLDDDGHAWIWYVELNDDEADYGDNRGYFEEEDALKFILEYDRDNFQKGMKVTDAAERQSKIINALTHGRRYYEEKGRVSYGIRIVSVD